MTWFLKWRSLSRAVGMLAVVAGVVGLTGTYVLVQSFLPEFQAGLICSGLLVSGGLALVVTTRAIPLARPAHIVSGLALAAVVIAIAAAIQTGVVLRLWVHAVGRFG